jgi:hypothetical protein
MSKRKARYYPKTSLLPDYSAQPTRSSPSYARRSHSTAAATIASVGQMNNPQFPPPNSDLQETAAASKAQQEKSDEEKKNLAGRLLRQLKGCASSENGSKLLDQLSTSPDYSEFSSLTGIDADEIKESLLLRAGGLSFKTSGGKTMMEEFYPDRINSVKNENEAPVSEDEKQIRSIKLEMIKSIYLKKLELNSSGRLLLPKSIRTKEDKDLKILQSTGSSSSTSSADRSSNSSSSSPSGLTPSSSSDLISSRSNQLVRKCMKGPLGRIKQRQLLANRKQSVNH